MADEPRRRPRYGCAFALVIAAAMALGVCVLLIFPVLRSVRVSARRTQRANHLKQIGLALHNFHDTYKRLPLAVYSDEGGRPLSSWRFHILAYVEAIMQHYYDPTERWDDPRHRGLTSEPFHVYCFRTDRPSPDRLHTNVVAITGPGTAFDGNRECRLKDIDSDTILAIEIAESGTHWAAPGDLPIDQVDASILQGLDGHGVLVLFADGQVWLVPPDVPLEDLEKFFTIEGAKKYNREQILGPRARLIEGPFGVTKPD